MKNLVLFIFMLLNFSDLYSHSVQVQYCVSCSGDLRIWLEHWHDSEDPSTTTMTISVTVNGNTSTITSSPGGSVMNIPYGSLPGCSTPIIYAAGCPGQENTYNDWVYYDFPGLPSNVPLSFTIISGNTQFTMDGCGMYPLTVSFSIPSSTAILVDDQNICDGNIADPVIFDNNTTWTNNNPSIGLPASGNGSIPSFIPTGLPGTTAEINFISTCASGSFTYLIGQPILASSSTSNYNGNNISCFGSSDGSIDMSISGGFPPYNYYWNNGQISEDLDSLTAGTYNVIITDSIGCSTSEAIILDEPSPLLLADSISNYNGYNISCFGYNDGAINLNVSGSVPGYTFLWSNGSVNQDLTGLSYGTYNVIISDSNLCSVSEVYNLIAPTIIEVTPIISEINGFNVCNGENNGFIQLFINGSVPNYNLQWDNGDTSLLIDSLSAGMYYYSIIDQNGCYVYDTIQINEPSIIIQEIAANVSCYGGSDGSVNVNVNGNTSPYYIFWNNNIATGSLPSGTYNYQIIDSIGCIYYDSLMISEPDSILIVKNIVDVSCFGENNGNISLDISGSTPPYNINWFGVDTNNLIAGTYNFTIVDSNNCLYSEIAIVSEPNPIDVLCQIIDPSCGNTNDGSVQLTINGGTPNYNIDWGNINPNALSIGTYNYVVNDANNCSDSNSVSLVAESNIQVVSSVNNISCNSFCDGSIDLQINGGVTPYNIDWFGYNANTLCEGLFYYEILDNIGCTYTDSFNIYMPDSVSLIITQNAMQLIANASGGTPPYSYQWYDDNSSLNSGQITNITTNGNYYCIAIDSNNCQSDTINYFYSETFINEGNISSVDIFPNPTLNSVSIQFLCNENQSISIYLTDLLGRKILIDSRFNFIGKYKNKINLSSYSNGMYLINIQTNNQNLVKKIIKK